MARQLSALLSLTLVLSLAFVTGCSRLSGATKVTPEMKMAVIRVANQYVADVARGNFARAGEMVIWADYLAAKREGVTKQSILKQIEGLKEIPYEQHPLRDLQIIRLDVRPEIAEVELRKSEDQRATPFVVRLMWAGRGWLVASDTLLGPNGALSKQGAPSNPGAAQEEAR